MRRLDLILIAAAVSLAACATESGEPLTSTAEAPLTCAPTAACGAVERECLGLADNSGRTRFGLRLAEIDVRTPEALRAGLVGRVVTEDIRPKDPLCRLDGRGSFSWLLRFDTAAGTLEMGGARPDADGSGGYAFLHGDVGGVHVEPARFDVRPDAQGRFAVAAGRDLIMPMFLDRGGEDVVLIPLRAARPSAGVLSASQGCIGRYNAEGLLPAESCIPDEEHHAFVTGGTLEGMIALEEADRVVLPSFSETLCVRLTGDPETYGVRDAAGILACKRDAGGALVFRGDACTDPSGACADAVRIVADFAASAVLIAE